MLKRLENIPRYEMAEGSPDVRGWEAVDKDNVRVGTIDHLYVNTDLDRKGLMEVHFLTVLADNKERLVPIEMICIDKENQRIELPDIKAEDLHCLPEYREETIDSDYERKLYTTFFPEKEAVKTERTEKTREFQSACPPRQEDESPRQYDNYCNWKKQAEE